MGIVGMTTSLAQEGGRKNVKCNVIAPTAMTQMTTNIIPVDL